ncbi:DNA-directed RNA polymerase subunit beta [Cohnella nanjingensis]|uniref:DNA-directed RNA polymerase subunit beta n=1 Tax=Cohnella nanjingensis TaxID=1387779 RepID=UPI0028A9AB40|nr:DNA-directed RNA polymerase subunit beta [Cohnella nanjingensis]
MTATKRPTDKPKRSAGRLLLLIVWTSVKILFIPVLCVAALIAGLAIGYVVLGKQQWSDVFDWNTWRHMYDLVFASGD